MTDGDEFLSWIQTSLYSAELALHNGDATFSRGVCLSVRYSAR